MNTHKIDETGKCEITNIAMICDEKFAILTKNCIRSIIATKNTDSRIRVYVICVNVAEETKEKLKYLETEKIKITIIEKNNEFANVLKGEHRVSPAALFKFQLPYLVPANKCLYMDGDIAVLGDLSDLYNTDIRNKYAAMAIDWVAEKRQKDHLRLQHRHYFNSGVMLLNLERMRSNNIPEKLLEDKRNDTFSRYMDQDAFNRVLYPEIVILDEKYNFHEEYDKLKNRDENYAYLKTVDRVVCRHYTKYKPTQDLKFPHSEEFWQYGDTHDFMRICIKNMRDDYARLYQHYDNIRKGNEELKRSIQIVNEAIRSLRKGEENVFLKNWFYLKENNCKKVMFFKLPIYSRNKEDNREEISILGISIWKSIRTDNNRKNYILNLPYKNKQINADETFVRWFGVFRRKKSSNVVLSEKENREILGNGVYECYDKSRLPALEHSNLNIAFLICGGLGDICVAANYLWYFRNQFPNRNIMLDVYVRNDIEMVKSIFKTSLFVNRVFSTYKNGIYFDIQRDDIEYDLFIRLVRFPDVLYKKMDRLKEFNSNLYAYVNATEDYKRQYRSVYSNDRLAAEFSLLRNQTRIQQPDIGSLWRIPRFFSYILPIDRNYHKFLYDNCLVNKTIITLHREVDLRLPENGVKLWEQKNFEEVISTLRKKHHSNVVFVQIGGDPRRSPMMKGVDKYLVGQISFEETKILLKHSALHIDCEGGFVHLQKALLGKGNAVVLFGPTDIQFYGYEDNINISAHACRPCENLSNTWFANCAREKKNKCVCMKSITPQMVLERISSYVDKKIKESEVKCKLLTLSEAQKCYRTMYFSFDGIGDTLLFRSAIEKLAQQQKRRILIGTKRYELFEDSKYVDILYGYNETSFNQSQKRELEEAHITPIFVTGPEYIKEKSGWRRKWPKQHLLTSLCGKLGIRGKIEICGHLGLSETEKVFGRFFDGYQIAIISKGMSEYKTIPLDIMQDIVNRLSDKYHFVQLGGEKDPLLSGVMDKRGCSDLREAAAVLYNSDLYVGGIGGLMHLARFVGTRSVIAYSHGEPPNLAHYACNEDVHPMKFGCNDCGKGKKFPYQVQCDANCIKGITADELIEAIEKQMQKIDRPIEIHYENVIPNPVRGLEEFIKKHGGIKE